MLNVFEQKTAGLDTTIEQREIILPICPFEIFLIIFVGAAVFLYKRKKWINVG
jgi:hypothetical protein